MTVDNHKNCRVLPPGKAVGLKNSKVIVVKIKIMKTVMETRISTSAFPNEYAMYSGGSTPSFTLDMTHDAMNEE